MYRSMTQGHSSLGSSRLCTEGCLHTAPTCTYVSLQMLHATAWSESRANRLSVNTSHKSTSTVANAWLWSHCVRLGLHSLTLAHRRGLACFASSGSMPRGTFGRLQNEQPCSGFRHTRDPSILTHDLRQPAVVQHCRSDPAVFGVLGSQHPAQSSDPYSWEPEARQDWPAAPLHHTMAAQGCVRAHFITAVPCVLPPAAGPQVPCHTSTTLSRPHA